MTDEFSRRRSRLYRPRYSRPAVGERDDSSRAYPTPSEMMLSIGAIIFVALCVALAADFLAPR